MRRRSHSGALKGLSGDMYCSNGASVPTAIVLALHTLTRIAGPFFPNDRHHIITLISQHLSAARLQRTERRRKFPILPSQLHHVGRHMHL